MAQHLRALLLLAAIAGGPGVLAAQEEIEAVLVGELLLAGLPVDTGTVVLHRVTPEEASDIDSTAIGAGGSFRLDLPNLPVPGSGEVFLASTRYEGVLYAGTPIVDPLQLDTLYTIRAYPSVTAPAGGMSFPVSRREVWVDAGPFGWQVTDVLEIVNSEAATRIPAAGGGPVWRYPLPADAIGGRILQVGPSAGPAHVEGTTLVASNPVLPAENYYVVQYDLESIEFDLPLPGETGIVQVMVREPAPAVRVEGLARQPSEELEFGATFMRWAGQTLRDQSIAIRMGEDGGPTLLAWTSLGLALVLVAAGSVAIRGRNASVPVSGRRRIRRDIVVDIAKLDEAYAGIEQPSRGATARYRRRRRALVSELEETEAGGGGSARR